MSEQVETNLREDIKPTTINDLTKYAKGTLVELPPFAEGQPFYARIRRPSMLAMVKSGKIPNNLISTANELFAGTTSSVVDVDENDSMKNLFAVLETICEACFIEPTYAEIKSAKIELTDDQQMFIFNYTQQGVNALNSFRRE